MAQSGTGLPKNLLQAYSYFNISCNGGYGLACSNLGVLLTSSSKEIANELFINSCNANIASGCNNIGLVAQNAGEYKAALEIYQKSCSLNNDLGCALQKNLTNALQNAINEQAAQEQREQQAQSEVKEKKSKK